MENNRNKVEKYTNWTYTLHLISNSVNILRVSRRSCSEVPIEIVKSIK